jgi:hypothetical protein
MFGNFYLPKHHKITNISITTETRQQISSESESAELKKVDVNFTRFKTIEFYFIKSTTKF